MLIPLIRKLNRDFYWNVDWEADWRMHSSSYSCFYINSSSMWNDPLKHGMNPQHFSAFKAATGRRWRRKHEHKYETLWMTFSGGNEAQTILHCRPPFSLSFTFLSGAAGRFRACWPRRPAPLSVSITVTRRESLLHYLKELSLLPISTSPQTEAYYSAVVWILSKYKHAGDVWDVRRCWGTQSKFNNSLPI